MNDPRPVSHLVLAASLLAGCGFAARSGRFPPPPEAPEPAAPLTERRYDIALLADPSALTTGSGRASALTSPEVHPRTVFLFYGITPTPPRPDPPPVSIEPAAPTPRAPRLVAALGPNSGPYTGGTRVILRGAGFEGRAAVSLGGIWQLVDRVRDSEIAFTTAGIQVSSCPEGGAVTATGLRVVDTHSGDSAEADLSFQYLVPLPRIFGLSPVRGEVGTTLTLSGIDFAPNVQVQLGDPLTGASAQVLYAGPSKVVVRVPTPAADFTFTAQAPTPISVTVRNLDGPGCASTFTHGFLLDPGAPSPPPPLPRASRFRRLFHRSPGAGAAAAGDRSKG